MAEPKFEKDLEKLEAIVQALEAGDLSLDDSLARFEEGIKLARNCEKALTKAEKRNELLTKSAEGELEAEPFGEEAEGEPNPAPASAKKAKAGASTKTAAAPDDAPPDDAEDEELLF